jgi:hypothetical protein
MIRVERREALTTLKLDNPGTANSLTAEAVEDLLRAVRQAHADGTQTLVLTGEGANFCSGFDLANLDAMRDADLLARFVRIELLLQASTWRRSIPWRAPTAQLTARAPISLPPAAAGSPIRARGFFFPACSSA